MARTDALNALAKAYLLAKEFVIRRGFHWEIDWQEDLSLASVTESDFLREAAWVVLCSGFRESVLRAKFQKISAAFLHWEAANLIYEQKSICRKRALEIFHHRSKIDAILAIATRTAKDGFDTVKRRIEREGVSYLMEFPFIGPITSFHLAKNLGLSVAKPDRHLVRVAELTGYCSPNHLCHAIGSTISEKASVVDIVIWRFATLNPTYEKWFPAAVRPCEKSHSGRGTYAVSQLE